MFDTDRIKKESKKMGINDYNKKYNLLKLLKETVYFVQQASKNDLVNGLDRKNNKMIVNTLITHKSQNTKKIVTGEIDIKR